MIRTWRQVPYARVLVAALLFTASPVGAQNVDSGINIGHSVPLWSQALKEQRRILVYLPRDYAQSKQAYPVMYLLDGEVHFHHVTGIIQFLAEAQRIPQMIVIGVTNVDRSRDFAPPTHSSKELAEDPTAGGAENFLRFMKQDLAPWVESRFRTAPFRILVGHSFGGLFNAYALVNDPQAFQAHIAISPSLWWDEQSYVERLLRTLADLRGPHFLFLSWGDNEPMISDPARRLAKALEAHPPRQVTWSYHYYKGDNHDSTPHRSLYDGLSFIFEGWQMPFEIDGADQHITLPAVEAHYAALSRKYGFKVPPAAEAIDAAGAGLLEKKQHEAALVVFQRNVDSYPWLPYVHEDLGKALETLGRFDDALAAYQIAMKLELEGEHPYSDPIGAYRQHAASVESKRTTAAAAPGSDAASAADIGGANAINTAPASAANTSAAHDYLVQLQHKSQSPGVSAAVAVHGKIIFADGIGVADLEAGTAQTARTVHNIGSISKTQAAVAVMQLVERGKVSLDAPIQTYVPWFPRKTHPISVRQILTHTSGIRHYKEGEFGPAEVLSFRHYDTFEESTRFWRDDPLEFKPGSHYLYSSYAADLMQAVIESASAQPFETYLRENIWAPAGMAATQLDVSSRIVVGRGRGYVRSERTKEIEKAPDEDVSYKYAGGGIICTDEDLARFGVALNSGRLLKRETMFEMFRLQLPRDLPRWPEEEEGAKMGTRQGLIFYTKHDTRGRTYTGHSGEVKGTGTMFSDYPAEDVIVVLHINMDDGAIDLEDSAEALADLFLPPAKGASR